MMACVGADAPGRLERTLRFLEVLDAFKRIERATWLADGSRRETDSDHCWHMALFALVLGRECGVHCDLAHAVELVLVHDLVEIEAGDVVAWDEAAAEGKVEREARAARRLFALLPADLGGLLESWWREFEEQSTPEARFALAVDRLQALAQNVASGGRAWKEYGVGRDRVVARNAPVVAAVPELAPAFEAMYRRADETGAWGAKASGG